MSDAPDPLFFETGQYNPLFFRGLEEQQNQQPDPETGDGIDIGDVNLQDYLKVDGSNIATQPLTMPGISLYSDSGIRFPDNSTQLKAYDDQAQATVASNKYKLQAVTYDEDNNKILVPAIEISKVIYNDGEQTKAYSDQRHTTNITNEHKLTNQTYDQALNETIITGTLYAHNFVTDSFNVSHLSGTAGNIQGQLNNHTSLIGFLNTQANAEKAKLIEETQRNDIQDTSLNTLQTSYDNHITDYDSNILRIDNTTDELYDLIQTEKTRNDAQDISHNILNTSYNQHVLTYNDYVTQTDNHLLNVDLSLNLLQSENITQIEADIDQLQYKSTNISYRTKGAIVDDLLHTKDILLDNVSSLGTPTIYFQSGEQISPFTEEHKTKVDAFYLNGVGRIATPSLGNGLVNDTHLSKLENISVNIQEKFNQTDTRLTSVENRCSSLETSDFQTKDTINLELKPRLDALENKIKNFTFTMSQNSLIDGIPVTPGNQQTYEGTSQWQSIYYLWPQSTKDSGLIGGSVFGTSNACIVNGRYLISGWFKFANLRWVQKLTTTLKIHNGDQGGTIQTLPCGIVRDASLAEEPDILYQIPPFYFSTSSANGAYFELFTEYHLNTFTNSEFTAQIQIVEI